MVARWRLWIMLWGLVLFMLPGCASWRVVHDLDAQYDFAAAHSVAIMSPALQGMQPVWVSELVAQRLEQALETVLQEKGLALKDSERADLLVEPGLHAEPAANVTIWGGSSGWFPHGPYGSYPAPSTAEVNAQVRVTVFLNVRDRPSRRLVYRAWSTEAIGPKPPDSGQLQRIMRYLMQQLPVTPGQDMSFPHQPSAGHGRGSNGGSVP